MKSYSYDAQYYNSGIGGFHAASEAAIRDEFERSFSELPRSARILDLGCGDGFYGKLLASKCDTVDGADLSGVLPASKNMQHYRNYFRYDLGTPVSFNESYDAIFSVECIEHVENYRTFLSNAHAALKPGGSLFLTTTTYFWSLFVLLVIYRRQVSICALKEFYRGWRGDEQARTRFVSRFWDYFTGHYHGFDNKQIGSSLREAGFHVVSIRNLHVQSVIQVGYLDQPYNGSAKTLVETALPAVKLVCRAVNWMCRAFDLTAPNIIVIARKPEY